MQYIHRYKIILLITNILFTLGAFAQSNLSTYDYRRLHFGFTIGFNNSSFKTNEAEVVRSNDTLLTYLPKRGPGLQLGIVSDFRVSEHIALRFVPLLMFTEKSIDYTFTNPRFNINKKVESAYVDLPLLIKLRSDRINNWRFYVVGGAKYWIDFASQSEVSKDVLAIKTNRNGIAVEYGFGWDFYLPYFKFSPEIKFYQGLNDVLVKEQHVYSASFSSLVPRGVIISLLFE